MQKSGIEWCDYTSNPVKGYCPIGCSYCYARKIYDRFKWDKTIRFVPKELEEWGRAKAGSRIFVGSTIELFHDKTIQYMPKVMDAIRDYPHLRILLLTKQPQNLIKFSPFPDNCWVGVTATDYWKYVDACNYLAGIKAKVKYISFEPLLSWDKKPAYFFNSGGINWVIIGAQTKPYKPPKIEWVEEIVRACDKAGVPVFLKDNLHLDVSGKDTWALSPNVGKGELWRQEMPKSA